MRPKVGIVIEIFALPGEKGYSRFHDIAMTFVQHGYDVDVLTSTFIHADKSKRPSPVLDSADVPYRVLQFDVPGYKKNISIKRIHNQLVFARKLGKYLKSKYGYYDCVYATIPDNYVAYKAVQYARRNGIPGVIDVEDLLPEGFRMVLDVPVISRVLFYPYEYYAEKVYRMADGVVGSCDEYRDRPFAHNTSKAPRQTVYVGINLTAFDEGAARNRQLFTKHSDEFWVSYTGTLGSSYDILTLVDAVLRLREKGYGSLKLMIAGDGPLRDKFQEHAKPLGDQCEFLGYLPYGQMAALLCESDIAINSLRKKANSSIVNKVGDYLAAGIPMINTGRNVEFCKKVEVDEFGINVEAEDSKALAEAIESLVLDKPRRLRMGNKARGIAEAEFDRAKAYPRIIYLMDGLRRDI